MHPVILDELLVLISSAFMETFTADEQAVIGTFLATLGSIVSLNSVYILYLQGIGEEIQQEQMKKEDDTDEDKYDILEKSVDKIKEEIEKLKETKH